MNSRGGFDVRRGASRTTGQDRTGWSTTQPAIRADRPSSALDPSAAALVVALRGALGSQWEVDHRGGGLLIRHRKAGSAYRAPRRAPSWSTLVDRMTEAFQACGVSRASALPLRWGRETDFTISAVQALDPYVKDGESFAYRTGFIPQPVVRFTGERDSHGQLRDGFLTSFVNTSCVRPTPGVDEHVALVDVWLTVLSKIGLNARHTSIHGPLTVWRRPPVSGITLRFKHLGLETGDLVLVWNDADPRVVISDLGSGLERLGWAITQMPWPQLAFGPLAARASHASLDALRTGTLIVGSGIAPATRGPGGALRRLMRAVPTEMAAFGLSRVVRASYAYWAAFTPLSVPWHETARILENEVLNRGDGRHDAVRCHVGRPSRGSDAGHRWPSPRTRCSHQMSAGVCRWERLA
jgi:hypothetical protein